jgi:hypothetical protein
MQQQGWCRVLVVLLGSSSMVVVRGLLGCGEQVVQSRAGASEAAVVIS